MAFATAIAGAAQIITGAQGLLGGNKKDSDRLAANAKAYTAALGGDANARDFLKQRTGQYGEKFIAGYGIIGGWATDVAKADAKAKYAALNQAATVNAGLAQAGGAIREELNAVGYDVVPTVGGMRTEHLLLLAAAGVALFLLLRR